MESDGWLLLLTLALYLGIIFGIRVERSNEQDRKRRDRFWENLIREDLDDEQDS